MMMSGAIRTESDATTIVGRQCEEGTMSGFVLKPHSTPATLLWLQANYEAVEGVCIPRNAMYNQYVEFCRTHGMMPVNAASFGKIIRQKFPGLTTRRLGTRGQSRYHYYGLAVKSDANLYAQSSFTRYGTNETNYEAAVSPNEKPSRRFVSNPLLRLPSSDILRGLPKSVPESAAGTIHIMYTLHCQQLIDYCVHFQFKEVKEYIAHFWAGFPSHLAPLLENNSIISLIGLCDAITYRAVSHVIIPCTMLEEVSARRAEDSIRLAESILDWLVVSLSSMPLVLRRVKLHAARTLLHTIRRQVSLNHLCSNLRLVLTCDAHLQQMFRDWEHLDMQVVVDEILFSVGTVETGNASQIIISCCKDLEKLLRSRPQLASLGNWVKKLVERCVTRQIESSTSSGERLRNFACNFLLIWTSVGTRILREMTLMGAHSFGTFHLLYLMLTEYGAQLVESLIVEDQIHRLTENVALGNPVDCNDFEAGVLCDGKRKKIFPLFPHSIVHPFLFLAQCPCKSRCVPGRKQQQHHNHHQNISDGVMHADSSNHSNPAAMTLHASPQFIHVPTSEVTGCANHPSETTQDVKVRYSDMRVLPPTEYCQLGQGEAAYYHHSSSSHGIPAVRPSCSFQEPICEGGHMSDSRLNQSEKNEVRLFFTSSEFTADMPVTTTVSHEQEHEVAVAGQQQHHHHHHHHAHDQNPVDYCVMDLAAGGESNVNSSSWYMMSSNMSGGECYDNFYASSHYLQQEPQSMHHQHPPQNHY